MVGANHAAYVFKALRKIDLAFKKQENHSLRVHKK